MAIEVELKFPTEGQQDVSEALVRLGAAHRETLTQEDLYFRHPCRDFVETDEALRVRCVNETSELTYKGPRLDAHTKSRRELKVGVSNGADSRATLIELLCALGFEQAADVRKRRDVWGLEFAGRDFEVCLDAVEGLGEFAEIETICREEEFDAARSDLQELAGELGLSGPEHRSYLKLLSARS